MIAQLKDLTQSRGGEWIITLSTSTDCREQFDELYGNPVNVEIKKASKKRSLNANAYAWVLIDKIAEKTGVKAVEVYQNAILDIGGIADFYEMKETAYPAFKEMWQSGHLGRQAEIIPGTTRPGRIMVKAYKGSSDFDSAQMARLIDSLVQDAEALGIPTLTENELSKMINGWRG